MNPTAMSLSQAAFQAALSPGTSTAPTSLTQVLAQLSTGSQLHAFDAETVGNSTGDEFPFLRSLIASGQPPDSTATAAWESVVRWTLSALTNWESNEVNSLNKLRALLSTVAALDAKLAGLSSVATQVASNQLTSGLLQIIESTYASPRFNDRNFSDLCQEIEASGGNLERLWQLAPHINFFPAPDFWTAVVFMYNAAPAALASVIEKRNDSLFSLMICTVLEAQAITLAVKVNNLIFKFVSVEKFWQEERIAGSRQDSQGTLQALLLQVAQTSAADWAAWMQALFKYPGNNQSLNAALGAVLHQLTQEHWTSFFKALSLSYSHRAASPVANILIQFSQSAGTAQRDLMWSISHQVWSTWDYGKDESQRAMFAPVACALDFPVAMYYAGQPLIKLTEEERNLGTAIDSVEQQWFDSATDLITERNKLKSRLRLVQHGMALANGSTQMLPPPIQPDADLYACTRYHYHDVNII